MKNAFMKSIMSHSVEEVNEEKFDMECNDLHENITVMQNHLTMLHSVTDDHEMFTDGAMNLYFSEEECNYHSQEIRTEATRSNVFMRMLNRLDGLISSSIHDLIGKLTKHEGVIRSNIVFIENLEYFSGAQMRAGGDKYTMTVNVDGLHSYFRLGGVWISDWEGAGDDNVKTCDYILNTYLPQLATQIETIAATVKGIRSDKDVEKAIGKLSKLKHPTEMFDAKLGGMHKYVGNSSLLVTGAVLDQGEFNSLSPMKKLAAPQRWVFRKSLASSGNFWVGGPVAKRLLTNLKPNKEKSHQLGVTSKDVENIRDWALKLGGIGLDAMQANAKTTKDLPKTMKGVSAPGDLSSDNQAEVAAMIRAGSAHVAAYVELLDDTIYQVNRSMSGYVHLFQRVGASLL